jgi:hypothetical protein
MKGHPNKPVKTKNKYICKGLFVFINCMHLIIANTSQKYNEAQTPKASCQVIYISN